MTGPCDKPDELLAENARLLDEVSKLQNEERISAIALMNADEMVCKLEADLRACARTLEAAELELTSPRGGYPEWSDAPGRVQSALNEIRATLARPGVREALR